MRYGKIIIFMSMISIFFWNCSKSELSQPIEKNFILNIEGKESIQFDNSECRFDNRETQSQFNYGYGEVGFRLFSTYKNIDANDSITSQIWVHLVNVYKDEQSEFDLDILRDVLASENSSENSEFLIPNVQIDVCGFRYDNSPQNFNTPYYWFNSDFQYEIEEFELLYDSDCITKDVLYIKINFSGKFYGQNTTDTLYINNSEMELLFDVEK